MCCVYFYIYIYICYTINVNETPYIFFRKSEKDGWTPFDGDVTGVWAVFYSSRKKGRIITSSYYFFVFFLFNAAIFDTREEQEEKEEQQENEKTKKEFEKRLEPSQVSSGLVLNTQTTNNRDRLTPGTFRALGTYTMDS